MPRYLVDGSSNLELLLAHARPGVLGLVGFSGRAYADAARIASAQRWGGAAGAFSHAFLVLDRRTRGGRDQIVILETTRVPPEHRAQAAGRGHPAWDGPQWSIAVSRDRSSPDAEARGHCNRRACRRYRLDAWAPNLALVDLGLAPAAVRTLQRRMRATLRPDFRASWAGRTARTEARLQEIAGHDRCFEEDDPLSGVFVAELLAGLVPELSPLPFGEGPLAVGRLYEALAPRRQVIARVRQPQAPAVTAATLGLASALSWMDGPVAAREPRRAALALRGRVGASARARSIPA